ncbi:PQQ-dependent sugar dehydrogenase [Algoriphagus winogradskyi]|uniref:Glucose/arabinose dehydrogenase, beta-propeller fold n=1 Tax=Algoriphagus winogradskyi TaxID=237017 RepID=A0ABY1P0D1_9BACT|nr:sorbosone dehydrogenase family protein [Algoriphagus winogradskyi]SMP22942.1 Glucose/arabinose dehydrogenase, beta-propeller fold [Algoriphagus winogradskyi]
MQFKTTLPLLALATISFASCQEKVSKEEKEQLSQTSPDTVQTAIGELILPPPYSTESVRNESKLVDWPEGKMPTAPAGFTVTKFAEELDNPRNTYVGPNGDLFVAESNTKGSADRITIFRDKDKNGDFETREVFKEGLNQPYGMLILNDYFFIANTDGLYRFPYKSGQLKLESEGEKIVDLPAGGYNNHWTRNLIANEDGSKIYISVGSASNVAEHGMEEEVRRAGILEINPDGTGEIIYASGLRNPVGMSWNPVTYELWTAVNERDKIGDDLVPDYITSVKKGGFYGWPYSYFGQIEDPRMQGKGQDLVEKAIIPDVPVGSHTASLGLTFYDGSTFPEEYRNGAFIGQHGSWNRKKLAGYKVLFVPFANGKPAGKPRDFLSGFVSDSDESEVYGRPVDVTVLPDGSLIVNDDTGNTLWRVSYSGN